MNRGCRGDIAELESCLRASYPDVHGFDFIGDRHLVLTSSAGDGWLWFEERPGPGPTRAL